LIFTDQTHQENVQLLGTTTGGIAMPASRSPIRARATSPTAQFAQHLDLPFLPLCFSALVPSQQNKATASPLKPPPQLAIAVSDLRRAHLFDETNPPSALDRKSKIANRKFPPSHPRNRFLSDPFFPTPNTHQPFAIPDKRNHLTSTPDEFYVISMVTRLSSNRRRGVTSMLAMLYLTLFATLAVGFYASTNTSGQVSVNEQRRYRALGAAESGMDFMRYQLFQTVIPPTTTADQVITQIYNDLAVQLNGTANLGTKTVGINLGATQIDIPSQPNQYITLASDGSKFRCTITKATLPVGTHSIVVKVVGAYSNNAIAAGDLAAVQLTYDPSERPTTFFDNGMASKGTVTVDTKNAINGTPASEASILSTSATNPPVTISSGSISGDITVVGPNAPSIAAGTSVGGSSIPADILANHVDHVDPSVMPEFPTPDTSVYAKYATTMYVAGKASYDNVYIPANLNPTIGGPITFRGVLLIKSPNNVKFNGNVNFQGVVVSDNSGVGTLLTNVVTFTGSGNTTAGLDTLPALPQFPPELRAMGGSFLIAPGYDVKFTGNFNAIAGNIVGDRINIQGSSDLAVTGSVIALKNTLTMGTNGVLSFKQGNNLLHTGLRFSDRYVPNPASYDEVKP